MDHPDRMVTSFGPEAARVAEMRQLGTAQLRRWGVSSLTETTELLISEIVTNAIVHGDGNDIGFSLSHLKGEVHIEVAAHSSGRPRVKCPREDEESGRGMLLIATLADDWGVSHDGSTVWCTVSERVGEG